MDKINVDVKLLNGNIPYYATELASGADLYVPETVKIPPYETATISLGICIDLPSGYEAQVRPRSSLSKKGLIVALGTIDNDYTGAIGVTAHNVTSKTVILTKGDRIAQLVVAPFVQCNFNKVLSIKKKTKRGSNGFGSTGK